MQVVAVAFEEGMFFHMQYDVEVAGRSAMGARFSKPGEADAGSVFHTGRNFCVDGSLTQHAAFAFALCAGIGDHTAHALTCRTGAGHAEESLLVAHLAAPAARAA